MEMAADKLEEPAVRRALWFRLAGEIIALAYVALIATIANLTGAFYVMFPELGALSHDVLTRPRGPWATHPKLLAITPVLTGVIGIAFTRWLPYGYLSVTLTVAGAIAVIEVLDSPIAPAISAGLLPLVIGVKSWGYPPGIMLGTFLLGAIASAGQWLNVARFAGLPPRELVEPDDDDARPAGYLWLVALGVFLLAATFCVELTGLRFILFPPLMVIGFEMLGHPQTCPWAKSPMWLPPVCFLTAAGGLLFVRTLGVGPAAAAASMVWGVMVLRAFDMHVPPALAVALLPMVMDRPTVAYPLSVGIGTLLLSLWYLCYPSLTRNYLKICARWRRGNLKTNNK